ncbi:hypothetical protein ACUNV4_08725 [Granulosicoccus sp. 3-233]|uniref:hypothetical protein n=1 Tax=Granulosicoccus sp. 3-233 TaxID=3417969 RepID=UPI003D335D20
MTKSFPFRPPVLLLLRLSRLYTVLARQAAVSTRKGQHCIRQLTRSPARLLLLLVLLIWQTSGHARGLLAEEQHVAASLAAQVPWSDAAGKHQSHPLGVQTLFIEKQESKNAGQVRHARVYQYDYTTQSARMLVIDLENRTLTRQQRIESVHLPLSEQEIAFARSLLERDASLLAALQAEHALRNATPFTTLDELDVKASIHEPLDSGDPCLVSRCALLSLFDASHTVFTTEPLIHLNTQQVGELRRR